MKRLLFLSLSFLYLPLLLHAQGIQFESGTWNDVLNKAREQNRLIYLDVYTTWCGPCKMMASKIFPAKEAGDKYNPLFINYKIDAEKGEGIEVAKKYNVTGYPTNLYINPVTEEVVYRSMGAPAEVETFVKRADIALAEYKDPMSWEEYEAAFHEGRQDKLFMETFLEKADRLDKNNDDLLNAYIAKYIKNEKPDTGTLKYLLQHTKTIDNKAFPLLEKNSKTIASLYPGTENYFQSWASGLTYGTMQKAVETKKEELLPAMKSFLQKYDPDGYQNGLMQYFTKEYYRAVRDKDKYWKATVDEATYLASKPVSFYKQQDAKQLEQAKKSLELQLNMQGIPDSLHKKYIDATLENNPSYKKSASLQAANRLNETCWGIYENRKDQASLVPQALAWSKKSLELSEGIPELWPMIADTYAHLLFLNGHKKEAIDLQEKAIETLKKHDPESENLEEFEAELQKMKQSSLNK